MIFGPPPATPAGEETGEAAPTPAAYVVSIPSCNNQGTMTAPAGRPLVLSYRWGVANETYLSLYMDSATHTLAFDGQVIPLVAVQTGVASYGPNVYYYWQIPTPAAGFHQVTLVRGLSQPIPDGFDINSDGVLETYGSKTFTCTINVE
jgi:hypothetical protein